jgi:phosphoserine aminotransferase
LINRYTTEISNPHGIPLVCDMSSDILTTPVNVSDFGLIFAGAQKNMGCAGVTTVIIREDLLSHTCADLVAPIMLDYNVCTKNGSMYNTPSTFAIYVLGLVTRWGIEAGGMPYLVAECTRKGEAVYGAIASSDGFYKCGVEEVKDRSRVNVVFRIRDGDTELEKRFLKEAEDIGMIQLGGHRSVGGIRVSLYNAMTLDNVLLLVAFMTEFALKNRE